MKPTDLIERLADAQKKCKDAIHALRQGDLLTALVASRDVINISTEVEHAIDTGYWQKEGANGEITIFFEDLHDGRHLG